MELTGRLLHVEWVVGEAARFEPAWRHLARLEVVVALLAAAAVAAAWWSLAGRVGARVQAVADTRLGALQLQGAALARAAVAASLLALSAAGDVLVPGAGAPPGVVGVALVVTQAGVAVGLVVGSPRRWGPALVGLVAAVAASTDVVTLLEAAHLVGVGVAAAVWRREAWGVRRADAALRVGLGLSLVVVAATEKLANPDLAALALEQHPQLDVAGALGLPVPRELVVVGAAAVEVLFGLLVVAGRGRALTSLVVVGPFVATLAVFGLPELVGHLPIYAVLLAVSVTPPAEPDDVAPEPVAATAR